MSLLRTEPSCSDERSSLLRKSILHTMRCGGRGHLASAFSLVEILRVLYDDILKIDPTNPDWVERDRCILSKGHGCLALYAILADKGFFPKDELDKFCSGETFLGGHPEYHKIPGVEATTGSLGHGPSIGIGYALSARMLGSDARVFVITGDGEINEGSVWEAAMCAGKHKLDNYTLLIDYNKLQSSGPVAAVQPLEPLADKWKAFGFAVREVDGHDPIALKDLLSSVPFETGKPNVIICHTVKGKGIKDVENNLKWHHKANVDSELMDSMFAELGGE